MSYSPVALKKGLRQTEPQGLAGERQTGWFKRSGLGEKRVLRHQFLEFQAMKSLGLGV